MQSEQWNHKLWAGAFLFWVGTTLTFMAGMSIGSGVFVAASLWVLYRHKELRAPLSSGPLAIASLAFFAASLLSVGAALAFPPLGLPLEPFHGLQKFHFFLLPFLACAAISATAGRELRLERHKMWNVLFGMTLLVSVVGILQFWASNIFPAAWLENRFFREVGMASVERRFHAQGLMYFHLSFASAMGFSCAWAGARVLWPLKEDSSREKLAWAALALLAFFALFFSYSRIAWIALAGILVTLAFLKRPRWGALALVVLLGASALLWTFSSSLRLRWQLGLNSLFERRQVWAGAREMILDRWLTGVGFGKTGYYMAPYETIALGTEPLFSSHAHNNFLDILAATGLPGFFAFLAWWGVLGFFAWRVFRKSDVHERWLPAACLAGLVGFHINGLTQVNFFDAKSQHSLMLWAGVVLALEWRRQKRLKI